MKEMHKGLLDRRRRWIEEAIKQEVDKQNSNASSPKDRDRFDD